MILQSGVLALGAWLVINGQATGGIIIASSILVSRALAPAEIAIAHWKGFVAARQAWTRLGELLRRLPPEDAPPDPARPEAQPDRRGDRHRAARLPASRDLGRHPRAQSRRRSRHHRCQRLRKSTLVRALVGVWAPARGSVRIDGAALDQWAPAMLGRHIGYLPQEAELFAGTIAENIARLDAAADPVAVVAAARAAGVNDLILRLPEGYETRIGAGGSGLSAGQRQRIGLARALYGNPFLVVLDEPNANLDAEGEEALTRAMLGVRARGGIVVAVAHRPSALAAVDLVLVMAKGRAQAFGPRRRCWDRPSARSPSRRSPVRNCARPSSPPPPA